MRSGPSLAGRFRDWPRILGGPLARAFLERVRPSQNQILRQSRQRRVVARAAMLGKQTRHGITPWQTPHASGERQVDCIPSLTWGIGDRTAIEIRVAPGATKVAVRPLQNLLVRQGWKVSD